MADPPAVEKITIYWAKEQFWYVPNPELRTKAEKKMILEFRYGPFMTKDGAIKAAAYLGGMQEKLASWNKQNLFKLYSPRFNDMAYIIEEESAPVDCFEEAIPGDPEGKINFRAVYNYKPPKKPVPVFDLVDPDNETLGWMKMSRMGFLLEKFL